MTVHLNSRVQLAVSILLIRADYVFLSQRRPSVRAYPGNWQSVFFNVLGNETPLAVARRRICSATGISLRRDRCHLLGEIHLLSEAKRPCRLMVFRVALRHGEVPLGKEPRLPPWIPFPIGEVSSLRPQTPTLKCSLELLFSQGGIRV